MQTFKYILFFFIAAAACIFTGCGSSSGDEPDPSPPVQRHTRTVLVYMAANNNLSSYATADINEMIAGASGIPAGSRLLVFRHHTDGTQRLIEIRPNQRRGSLRQNRFLRSRIMESRHRMAV